MWNEVAFIKKRSDAKAKLETVLMQAAIGSMFSKEGGQALKELLEDL